MYIPISNNTKGKVIKRTTSFIFYEFIPEYWYNYNSVDGEILTFKDFKLKYEVHVHFNNRTFKKK